MTCQRCRDEASVHLTETVNGQRRELHLCVGCARKAGVITTEKPALAFDAVLNNLIIKHVGELVGALAELGCPYCGLKFMQFRAQGRLGCPHDYQAFSRGLEPLIKRAHGASRHVGKRPHHWDDGRSRLALRAELREAIGREDYEEAARLRDLLRPREAEV